MNFAGCFPFCYQLFIKNDATSIFTIISNPLNIVIMYASAMVGYIIECGVVGFVASLMVQKGKQRLIEIKKIQENLSKKWGPEVTGEMRLDENGFPMEE